ncbi:pentapeptide repeat-containing protein [Geminocystis sp. CENA526]|uniref:pentapeptide repeat-containing protein n=1 Tax=Geminocystis sp. CENA526 TaxID=1355871 RepID=UPI003D6E63F7
MDYKDFSNKKSSLLIALITLLLPIVVISLVIERPVEIGQEKFNFIRGFLPYNPLLTIFGVVGLVILAQGTFPKTTQKILQKLSSPKAIKVSLIISLTFTTVAGMGFFHEVAAAATRDENEAGSWFEGVNTVLQGAGLIIQSLLTYSLYVLTREQTKQSINQSAAAAAANTQSFSVNLINTILTADGVMDPRKGKINAIRGLLFSTINGIRMGSSSDLHTVFVQLLENNLTSPILLISQSNSINTDQKGNPICCYCADPLNSSIIQVVDLGDKKIVQKLEGSILDEHMLDGFDFWGAIIKKFSLQNTSLTQASLIRATFIDVDFRGADFSGAIIVPSKRDRMLADEFGLRQLPDEEILPKFLGNCQFEGARIDRNLYELLKNSLGDNANKALEKVIING